MEHNPYRIYEIKLRAELLDFKMCMTMLKSYVYIALKFVLKKVDGFFTDIYATYLSCAEFSIKSNPMTSAGPNIEDRAQLDLFTSVKQCFGNQQLNGRVVIL